jgi:endopolyphosphatase
VSVNIQLAPLGMSPTDHLPFCRLPSGSLLQGLLVSLINATFDWIRDELKDSIDFVIWTGDSARHDNDEKIPRNVQQVTQLNQLLVNKFYEVFGKDQQEPDDDPTNDLVIPVIPTFGK